jgi:hypothetical protein
VGVLVVLVVLVGIRTAQLRSQFNFLG